MKKLTFLFTMGLALSSCTSSNSDKAVSLVEAAMGCNVEKVKEISPTMSEMFALGCQPKEVKGKLSAKSFGNVGQNNQELLGVYQDDKLFACMQTVKDSDHLAPHKKLTACRQAEKSVKKNS